MARLSSNSNILGGDYYSLSRAVGKIIRELGNDVDLIMSETSLRSPAGFLRNSYSKSSSNRVYYAPRGFDMYPPRQNTLKDPNNFSSSVSSNIGDRGFFISTEVSLTQGYRMKHKSVMGRTKGQAVYPWHWIDQGTTYKNRFSGNPMKINQSFTRDWHTQGYRGIFISKVSTQLRRRGWDVSS